MLPPARLRARDADSTERTTWLTELSLALALAAPSAAPALAQDADLVAAGEKVFKRCAACHQVGPDAKNRVGPNLTGVIGRTAGTDEGFNYSDAMIEAGDGRAGLERRDALGLPRGPQGGGEGHQDGLRRPEVRGRPQRRHRLPRGGKRRSSRRPRALATPSAGGYAQPR